MRMSDWEPSEAWQPIRRALDARRSAIEDVGVNLRGGYVPVPEELLHGADVVAVFQQVGCEGVSEVPDMDPSPVSLVRWVRPLRGPPCRPPRADRFCLAWQWIGRA
jgi:hypothetical protein